MKLRITYEFDITKEAGVVFIASKDGYIGRGATLQEALDRVNDVVTSTGFDDEFTFDIVDVNPEQDAELINSETALVRSLNKDTIDFTPLTEALEKLKQSVKQEGYDPS